MSYWIFNVSADHTKIEVEKTRDKRAQDVLVLENFHKRINTSEEDKLLTLDKNGSYYFNHFGEIIGQISSHEIELNEEDVKGFEKKEINPVDYPKKYKHKIPVKLNKISERLEDYTFSLIAVENYSTPENHFRHDYTKSNKDDYETIVNKWVFVSRSVFGRLYNCLPIDDQTYLLNHLTKHGDKDIRSVGFINAIKELREFIEGNIIDTGKYLIASEALVNEHFLSLGIDINEVGFFDNSNEGLTSEKIIIDTIKDQATEFKDLFSLDYDLALLDTIEEQVKQNKDIETRFEKIFKSQKWPIRIKV
jgi:hypothetical protein